MKKYSRFILPLAVVLSLASCDKGFVEKNQNPYALTKMEPQLLLAGAQRGMNLSSYEGEQTIVQQFVNGYNTGATSGFNFNDNVDGYNNPRWAAYTNVIKSLVQILALAKDDDKQKNLVAITRIWRAYAFMTLVDTYGNVPYSEAAKGYLEGINYPKYDDDEAIYNDLYTEIKAGVAALATTNEYVKGDLFFGGGASNAANITYQVGQWKKVGNSLLLRLGMRYSSVNAAKAQSIAQEAFAGGVMTSNADNVYIKQYNSTVNNPYSNQVRTINTNFYYLAEPFVNRLKNDKDPRLKYIGANYANPANITTTRDTVANNFFGYPVGYDNTTILAKPDFRGAKGGGFNYTQINYEVVFSAVAPQFFITNAQTQLLLAEAKLRGWLPTAPSTAAQYYEAGIRANMDEWQLFPNVPNPAIPEANRVSYLNQTSVALSAVPATALEQINTQYWIACFVNGAEGWANWRRTQLPVLQPNAYNTKLNGGFVRRMAYPINERTQNTAAYNAAVAAMGGDDLTQRVFWDVTTKVTP